MFFSDLTGAVGSLFQPSAASEAPTYSPAPTADEPAQDWTAGEASAEATTTAFGHYTDPEIPTGLMDDADIEAINAAATHAGSTEPALEAIEAMTPEQREAIAAKMEEQSGPPVVDEPVGPLSEEEAAAAAKKAVDESLAKVNDAVAKAVADDIAELATEESEDGLLGMGDVFGAAAHKKKQELSEKLEGLTPEMRQQVLAKLGEREGDAALSEDQLESVQVAAESVTEDEEHAKKMEKKTDEVAAYAEKAAAAEGNHTKAIEKQLDGLSPKRREEAMEKMSPEARAAAEEALENRKKRLENLAERLEKAQHGKGVTDCTDEAGIVAGLSGLSENEAEELEEIYGEKFKDGDKARSLKKDLQAEFGKDDKESKFIGAVFDGDTEEADKMSVDLAVSYLEDEAGAILDTDEDAMNDLLRAHNKNPEAAKRITDAYFEKTGKELSVECEDVMDPLEFKEASANMEGDPRTANVAVIEQGNGERSERVVEDAETESGGIETLTRDFKDHTGKDLNDELKEQLPADKAEAVETQIDAAQTKIKEERDATLDAAVTELAKDPKALAAAKAKAEEVAGKLDTALSQMHVIGNNTEVTDPLRGLSPAEVKLVMDAYAEKTASLDPDKKGKNLEEELHKKLEGKDLKVANAVLSGDNVLAAVAFVEQAADNTGTDVEGWKKSMDTLKTKKERERFLEMMSKHQGGKDAYAKLVKSETSSFDRDTLNAHAILDDDERKATLASVEFTKNAYGGLIAGWQEGFGDTVGDLNGETEAQRKERRQGMRKYDALTRFSNLGGSEDAQLDAMAGLENEKQQRIFNEQVKGSTGKTTEEIVDEEMSDHHKETGKKFARGEYEDAQAERMVAELDCYVDNREDAASKPFEQVRLKQDQLDRIGAIPEGPERDTAIKAEQKKARESLLEKADEAAKNAGYEGYLDMLRAKGVSEADLDVAEERIADGKVSDATALFKAGDTTVGDLGKDAPKFYEVMKNKSPDEMDTLRKDFEAKHPDLKFDAWVRDKATSAGQKKDFEMMLEGNYARMEPAALAAKAADPDGQRALIKRVMDLEAAARGGADENPYDPLGNLKRKVGNAAGNVLADSIGNAGERLDGRVDAVKKLEAKLDAGEGLSSTEQEELVTHMRYMSGDQQAYTDTKTEAVNTGAKVVGKLVEGGTIALTGNQTLATAAGGMAEIEVMGTFDPGRFGADEAVAKLTEVAFNTAGSYVGGRMKNPLAGAAVEGMFGGAGTELGNTKNWNDPGQLVAATGKSMGNAAVAAVASAGVEQIGGDGLVTKVASATAEEVVSGDESQTFKQRLGNVAKSVVEEGVNDVASGHHAKRTSNTSSSTDTSSSSDTSSRTPSNDNGVDIKPVIQVDGDTTPVDSGVDTKPIIQVEGDTTPVDSGVDIKPVIQVEGDTTPVDAPANDNAPPSETTTETTPDTEGDTTPADSGVDIKPVIQVEGTTPVDAPANDNAPAPETDTTPETEGDAAPAPSVDIDSAPDTVRDPARPTAFGDESSRFGVRSLDTNTEHGPVTATAKGPTLDMDFPDAMPSDQKRELARDALARMNLEASDTAIDAAIDAHARHMAQNPESSAPVRIDHVLHVTDEASTIAAAREILFSDERVAERDGKGLDYYKNQCSKASGTMQHMLAAKGIYAPIMDNGSHRYLVVGNQIIDPTFAQFFDKSSTAKDGNEPFIGDYDAMVKRLAENGIADPAGKLASEWGILGRDEKGNLRLADHVGAFNGDTAVVPKTAEDVRRLMEEQEQMGLPPGAGLPPHLVAEARGEAPPERPVDTTPATPTTKTTEDGFEIPIDPFATPKRASESEIPPLVAKAVRPDLLFSSESIEAEQAVNPAMTEAMAHEYNAAAERMSETAAGREALEQLGGPPQLLPHDAPQLQQAAGHFDGKVTLGVKAGDREALELTAVHEARHKAAFESEVGLDITRASGEEDYILKYLVHEGRSYGAEIRYADEALAAAEAAGETDRAARLLDLRQNTIGYDAYRTASDDARKRALDAGAPAEKAEMLAREAGARAIAKTILRAELASGDTRSGTGYMQTARTHWNNVQKNKP
ncbi:MAG: hypothetical protein ACKV2T_10550 [Kofleriaceae bacterium]